ncbi:MAG: ATP-dependent DNA ligase, partial [Pseudomonadota bacterium]
MDRFAALLDRLVLTPQRNGKLQLIADYCRDTEDPDRGYAIAAITRDLEIASVKPAMIRELVEVRVDPILFRYSYDFVGDLAETVSLVWPTRPQADTPSPSLATVVETLQAASRRDGPKLIAGWLDILDAPGRYALLKLVTGGMRIGVSARLAKQALAQFGDLPVDEIEELWHGLEPPYEDLFKWLGGTGPKPETTLAAPFRPVMLAHPLLDKRERDDP